MSHRPRRPGPWRLFFSTVLVGDNAQGESLHSSLSERTARAVLWSVGSGLLLRGASVVGSVWLTHLIAPDEYGQVMAAVVCATTATALTSLSVPQYVIARRAGPEDVFRSLTLQLGLSGLALLGVVLLRRPVLDLIEAPGAERYVPILSLSALFTVMAGVMSALVLRDLHFYAIARVRVFGEMVFMVVAIGLAPVLGGLAIALGNLARSMIWASLYAVSAMGRGLVRVCAVRLSDWSDQIRFGAPLSAASMMDFLATRWDNLIISRFYGTESLGSYNLAYNLSLVPTEFANQISEVIFPAFAKLERGALEDALPKSVAAMLLVASPLAVGLGVVAPTLVATLLDARWHQVGGMLSVLCVIAIGRAAELPLGAFLTVRGRPTTIFALSGLKVAFVLGAILLVGRTSVLWSCAAAAAGYVVFTASVLASVQLLEGVRVGPILRRAAGPLAASVAMGVSVLGMQAFLQRRDVGVGFTSLTILIAAGAVTYGAALLLFARQEVNEVFERFRRILRPGPSHA